MPLAPNLVIEGQKKLVQKTDWFSVLPSLASSGATRSSGYITNPYGLGVWIRVDVTNLSGTPTFTPSVQMQHAYDADLTIWTAATPISANGGYDYVAYVADFTSSAITEDFVFPLPRSWKFTLTYGGTGTADVVVTARYI